MVQTLLSGSRVRENGAHQLERTPVIQFGIGQGRDSKAGGHINHSPTNKLRTMVGSHFASTCPMSSTIAEGGEGGDDAGLSGVSLFSSQCQFTFPSTLRGLVWGFACTSCPHRLSVRSEKASRGVCGQLRPSGAHRDLIWRCVVLCLAVCLTGGCVQRFP